MCLACERTGFHYVKMKTGSRVYKLVPDGAKDTVRPGGCHIR